MNTTDRFPTADRWAWLLIALVIAALFLQAPHGGAFYWSDAPRHALNGVFVWDLLTSMPLSDPAGYAYRYYAQYPALTILFYPPLFYFLSAPFFGLLGVSHEVALLVVFLHYLALGWGTYRLARFWLAPFAAACVALLLVCLPELAFWGRQVMLEVPAFAFLVWSAVAFVAYLRGAPVSRLYLAGALLVLAMYTKISVAFVALAYVVALWQRDGLGVLRNRHHWAVALIAAVALVPLMVLTVKFGQANVQSVTGVADSVASRTSLAGWLWYLRQIPSQMGWALTAAALLGALAWVWRGRGAAGQGRDGGFWLTWFVAGYVFYSLIDLKEARHSVYLLLPLVLAAVVGLSALLPPRWLKPVLGLLVLATAVQTFVWRPVFYVDGYAKVVDEITRLAPRDSVVLFSGYRDGSFVFNLRAREDRRDLSVLRADKILLSVAVRRELGVEQKDLSVEQMADIIDASGVHYVVMQPGFWTDLEVMRRFESLMASPRFEVVARIPTPANHRAHETELVILRNKGNVGPKPDKLNIELKIINRRITVQ
ncbi:ArnT family glycosyltransferase [Hydrogenophaga crocea]|uniref:Glycosyltransferase family 39 protein n=1 Tax=Hydrogenophaga crocea TaxID=2716225 RepID=A0A6G8IFC6_9BURK|nr:glycosyltransferase family 39 protein [Hydrogenophaga crocea]QIM51872.1 glycosyltransferase family 39 protein [Hydrogenophaga crocea]